MKMLVCFKRILTISEHLLIIKMLIYFIFEKCIDLKNSEGNISFSENLAIRDILDTSKRSKTNFAT